MNITRIKEHIGAEVTGIDLREPVDAGTRKQLNDALVDHTVLIIKRQDLTPLQYQHAAEVFGELMPDQNPRYAMKDVPLVRVVSNRNLDSTGKPANNPTDRRWHTDHVNLEYPPKCTMLYGVKMPDQGGATGVCNMRAAYAALPDEWKERIKDMKTANTLISSALAKNHNPDVLADQAAMKKPLTIHPLVRTHPESGTKAIWFHQSKVDHILGMSPEKTQAFFFELLDVAIRPDFVLWHRYDIGDMLIVDNRQAMHKAPTDFDHSQERTLYRALAKGDRPH
jgi:alpha-ketoglutarate-dependent taurine dioxygenase